MPAHARMCQDMPGVPGPFPVWAMYPMAKMARNCDQPSQGSGVGLEALCAVQESVGEATEPCTSERD